MDIAKQFKTQVERAGWFSPGQTAVVAVSTGVDSMVLLTLLQQLPTDVRPRLVVAHVNHQLRQQSDAEEDFIRDYCRKRHLQLAVTHWSAASHPEKGVEAAARRFRYRFFAQIMHQYHAQFLLTAHHADDQAETVMMKLVRGGQLAQLQGILPAQPFKNGQLVRPLLGFSKAQIRNYAAQQQLTWYEDETNQIDDVFRNRVRHQLIPALKQENPAFLKHIQQYTDQLRAALQLTAERSDELVQQVHKTDRTYSVARWQQLTAVQQRAVLRTIFHQVHLPITASYLNQATQLLTNDEKPNAKLDLADSLVLAKAYDEFSIKSELKVPQNRQPADKIVVISNQWVPLSRGLQVRLIPDSKTVPADSCTMMLELRPEDLPLRIRQARPDDHIKLIGGGHKTVRRILIDHKVPRANRSQQLVAVTAQGEVLWLLGLQRSARRVTAPNYQLVLKQSD